MIRPEPTFSGKMESIIPESLRALTRWPRSPRTLGTRLGWTKKRQTWKSGDETSVETAILNVLTLLREIVALANSKKNGNIEANSINFISKLTFVSKHRPIVCFVLQIDRMLLSMFCMWFVTLWKSSFPRNPPTPWKLLPFNPPSPSEFPIVFRGGGMDIFWNHTIFN